MEWAWRLKFHIHFIFFEFDFEPQGSQLLDDFLVADDSAGADLSVCDTQVSRSVLLGVARRAAGHAHWVAAMQCMNPCLIATPCNACCRRCAALVAFLIVYPLQHIAINMNATRFVPRRPSLG